MVKCELGLTIIDEAWSEKAFNDTENNGIDFTEMVEVLEAYKK